MIFNLKSQDSLKTFQIGFDLGLGNNALGRGNIYPALTLSKGKHVAFAGPAFIYGIYYNPYPPSYGVQMGYQFYPNGRNNRFNLFFEYDFNYVRSQFHFGYYSTNQTALKKQGILLSSVDNYLGFGFRLNLSKGLYFKTNLGVGLIYYGEKYHEEYNDGTVKNYSSGNQFYFGNFYPFSARYTSYFGTEHYYDNRFVGIVKVSIGSDFHSFKKQK